MAPLMPSKISTPRLTLIRLTNTSPSHPHVQLFHENWSDPTATAWSLHGATKSLDESRDWMTEHLTKYDNIFYAVFAQPDEDKPQDQKTWTICDTQGDEEQKQEEENKVLGVHVGSVSLRLQPTGPVLPPFPAPASATSHPENSKDHLDLRVLGYALFPHAWGKGYATEANRALLSAYASAVSPPPPPPPPPQHVPVGRKFYVEAAVDEDNAASQKVLAKLGFSKVGWKDEVERVWLNGGWRGPGYWVYGMYV